MTTTEQLSLAPVKTLYRATDAHTSGQAADGHDASGRRVRHSEMVLSAVRDNPGRTAAEIGYLTGLGHIEAQRRLSDLKNAHRVRVGPARKCWMKESRMVTWWAVTEMAVEVTT